MIEVFFRLQAIGAKRGEMWPVSYTGKDDFRVKHGKTCNWCHAQANMEAVSSAYRAAYRAALTQTKAEFFSRTEDSGF